MSFIFFVSCLLLTGYFGYHLVHGKYGLNARHDLEMRISKLNLDLSHLTERRERLDRDVALMQPEQIDPDMLDEQARRVLNMARPEDLILLEASAY